MAGKITHRLIQTMNAVDNETQIPVIVKYREGVVTARAFVAGASPRYHFGFFHGAAWNARPQEVANLAQAPEIEKIWLDLPVHIWQDQPVHSLNEAAISRIGAPQVWNMGITGQGVKIAIVDTGIDPNHPDLAGRVAGGVNLKGGSFADDNGHGTHVAGSAAGNGAASGGRYRGVAPGATLYAAKALDSEGNGLMSDVMAGVEWAVAQHAQIITLSLGSDGPADGTDALSESCNVAVQLGVVVCVAAGNSGPGPSSVGAPGAAQQVITIGAASDADGVMDFSARGPTKDNRVKPDICFPGENIISCRASGSQLGRVVDNYYMELSGTSMAAPLAAGAAALILQLRPGTAPAQVKDLLMRTAVNLGLDPNTQGSGRADIFRAISGGGAPSPTPPQPPTPGPAGPSQPVPPTPVPPVPDGCGQVAANLFRRK